MADEMDDMDDFEFVLEKNFHIHSEKKRLTMSSKDLNMQRLVSLFKVDADSIYLEDDLSRETFFPKPNGKFDTSLMRDRGSFTVCGNTTAAEAAAFSPPTSSTPHTGFSFNRTTLPHSPSATSLQQRVPSLNTFQNPLSGRKAKSVRRQIYIADLDDNGKINAYSSIHVTLNEGLVVKGVANLVKEYINSEDDYTICDCKGLEITDSAETKDLEFWKAPSRKLYAVKSADLMKRHRPDPPASKKKRTENAVGGTSCALKDFEDLVKLEISNMTASLKDGLEERCEEIVTSINQLQVTMNQSSLKLQVLDTVAEKVADVTSVTCISKALRQALTCRICFGIPVSGVVVTACCGQVAGCGECIQTYVSESDTCLLCKADGFVARLVNLKGFEDVLNKLH